MYGEEWPKVGVTLALLWLKRGLRFILVFQQSICDGDRNENHLNLIQVNTNKPMRWPLRSTKAGWCRRSSRLHCMKLPKGALQRAECDEEECLEKICLFLVNCKATINAIYDMYTRMNAELDYIV